MTISEDQRVYLHDGVIGLRPPRMEDAQSIWEAVQESAEVVGQWLPRLRGVHSIADVYTHIRRMASERASGTFYSFAIVDHLGDDVLGGTTVWPQAGADLSGSLIYWVRTSRQGEGIAPRATRLLADWAFATLGCRRIELVIALENLASIRVADKLGALREGFLRNRLLLNGELHDAVIYALNREEHYRPPAPLS